MLRFEQLLKSSNKELNDLFSNLWFEIMRRHGVSHPEGYGDTIRSLLLGGLSLKKLMQVYTDVLSEMQRRAKVALKDLMEAYASAEEQQSE